MCLGGASFSLFVFKRGRIFYVPFLVIYAPLISGYAPKLCLYEPGSRIYET